MQMVFKLCSLYFKEDTFHPHYKYPSLYDILESRSWYSEHYPNQSYSLRGDNKLKQVVRIITTVFGGFKSQFLFYIKF